jgi:hypothetical protein
MKVFLTYLKDYFRAIPLNDFILTSAFVAGLIFLNYSFRIEHRIKALDLIALRLILFYLLFLLVFSTAYWIHGGRNGMLAKAVKTPFLFVLLLAPLYFAIKMIPWRMGIGSTAVPVVHNLIVLAQLPLRLLLLVCLLMIVRRYTGKQETFFGLSFRDFRPGPYIGLLVLMIPLIAFASTRPDFLSQYPKFQHAGLHTDSSSSWIWSGLYQVSYGIDFVTIELFFRGFLVIGLMPYAGIRCILPMAAFYCSVHFGKPMGECISSYFGGLVLGVIASRTRLITGGLLIHMGIAWLMELGGYLGHLYINSRP